MDRWTLVAGDGGGGIDAAATLVCGVFPDFGAPTLPACRLRKNSFPVLVLKISFTIKDCALSATLSSLVPSYPPTLRAVILVSCKWSCRGVCTRAISGVCERPRLARMATCAAEAAPLSARCLAVPPCGSWATGAGESMTESSLSDSSESSSVRPWDLRLRLSREIL